MNTDVSAGMHGECSEGSEGSEGVDLVALDAYTTDLVTLKLAQRNTLARAANGRPIAPSDLYARRVLKDIQVAKSQEFKRLLATDLAAIRDGVPLPIVKQWPRRYEAILDVEAGQYRPRSLVALNRAETREQCLVDLAQLRIASNDDDLDALEHLAGQASQYRAILDEIQWEVDRRIARKTGNTEAKPAPSLAPVLVRMK